jgi:hypothetical protein
LTQTFPHGFAIPAAPSIEKIMMESEHLISSRVIGQLFPEYIEMINSPVELLTRWKIGPFR